MGRNHITAKGRLDTPEPAADTTTSSAKGGHGEALPPLVAGHQIISRGRVPRKGRPAIKPDEKMVRVDPPKTIRYKVTKGGRIANTGMPSHLADGKTITNVQYDIGSLRAQGIELKEIVEEETETTDGSETAEA